MPRNCCATELLCHGTTIAQNCCAMESMFHRTAVPWNCCATEPLCQELWPHTSTTAMALPLLCRIGCWSWEVLGSFLGMKCTFPSCPSQQGKRQIRFRISLQELCSRLPYLTHCNKLFAFIPPNVLQNCVTAHGCEPSVERNPVIPCIISS